MSAVLRKIPTRRSPLLRLMENWYFIAAFYALVAAMVIVANPEYFK